MAAFARVVDLNGFSAAAKDLGLSKSKVSKLVACLEDEMGARLLNRTTRRLSLTEAGQAFYQGAQRAMAEADAAQAAVTQFSAAPRGVLRVNAPMSFGVRHVAPALSDFLSAYPEVSVELDLNDRVVDLVEEGYDLAIRIVRLRDSSLIARVLAPSRNILCAAPAYLARRGTPCQPEDLSGHDCLIYSYQATGDRWRFTGPGGERQVKIGGRVRANNGDALLRAALGGLGIALLPSFICGEDLRAGRLLQLLPEWNQRGHADVSAVYPASRNLLPKVRVFIDFLAAHYGPTPYWDEGVSG
jgi:DNA-binding transcriptional LysR family regulator